MSLLARINSYLLRWGRKQYKRLRSYKKAMVAWRRATSQYPRLFAHWAWVTADATPPRNDRDRPATATPPREQEGWLGEIEGIDLTLQHLDAKRRQAQRLTGAEPVPLGMPTRRGAGNATT